MLPNPLIREGVEEDAIPVGIPECGIPGSVRMKESRFFEFEPASGGFLVDRSYIATAEIDEIFGDMTLEKTEGHIVVLENAPVLRPVVFDDAEVELQIELDRSREVSDVEAGIVLAEVHSRLPFCL